jgi:hypothetical protein
MGMGGVENVPAKIAKLHFIKDLLAVTGEIAEWDPDKCLACFSLL